MARCAAGSADGCLSAVWCLQVDCAELEATMRKLRRGGAKGQLLVARLRGQMSRRAMSPTDLFDACDRSGDGVLSGYEFRRALPGQLPGASFVVADVSVRQILVTGLFSGSEVEQLFKAIDVRAVDFIDLAEMSAALAAPESEQNRLRDKVAHCS